MHRIILFMCGDVMTGRGIDQVLPHPSQPRIHEFYMRDAGGYVTLAERANGLIPKPVSYDYIWGDAREIWAQVAPDVRLINLETSVTTSNDYWQGKGIHYRMHPANIPCLTAAQIDVCALANNHVLDWGYAGLEETLATLRQANIKTTGAGHNRRQAIAPAIVDLPNNGRVLVFSVGSETSGIPTIWVAQAQLPGVNRLPDLSADTVQLLQTQVRSAKQPGDIVVVSIHWGGNWGYEILYSHIQFAHQLIEMADVDVIHGHSSHHAKGIEVYQDKLIIYGCGDFLNDYEGISGHEQFRGDLSLMYFASLDPASGQLMALQMMPMQMKRFQLHKAAQSDGVWLKQVLDRQGKQFGTSVSLEEGDLRLNWREADG